MNHTKSFVCVIIIGNDHEYIDKIISKDDILIEQTDTFKVMKYKDIDWIFTNINPGDTTNFIKLLRDTQYYIKDYVETNILFMMTYMSPAATQQINWVKQYLFNSRLILVLNKPKITLKYFLEVVRENNWEYVLKGDFNDIVMRLVENKYGFIYENLFLQINEH